MKPLRFQQMVRCIIAGDTAKCVETSEEISFTDGSVHVGFKPISNAYFALKYGQRTFEITEYSDDGPKAT